MSAHETAGNSVSIVPGLMPRWWCIGMALALLGSAAVGYANQAGDEAGRGQGADTVVPSALPLVAVPAMPRAALPFVELIRTVAGEYGLDEHLLHAVIGVESAYQSGAVSPKGAIGLMQVMPETGARFGFLRLEDPATNVRAGAHYLKWLLERFDDDLALALAAYNAGEGAVLRHQRKVPPFPETRDYVHKVLARYETKYAMKYGNERADVVGPRRMTPITSAASAATAHAASSGVAASPIAGGILSLRLMADLLLLAPPRPVAVCADHEQPTQGRRSRRGARAREASVVGCG